MEEDDYGLAGPDVLQAEGQLCCFQPVSLMWPVDRSVIAEDEMIKEPGPSGIVGVGGSARHRNDLLGCLARCIS